MKDVRKGRGRFKSVEGLEEAVSLRSAGLKMFKVPGGGAHIAQIFSNPIHYLDDEGLWREIDSSIAPVPGGFANGDNSFDVFFPDRLTAGRGVVLKDGDYEVSVSVAGAAPSKADATAAGVTYAGVAEDTDLRYLMTATGYKEDVVLKSPAAPSTVEFEIATEGMDLRLLQDGRLEAHDGDTVFGYFPPFFAQEQTSDGAPGEMTYDVTTELTETGSRRYRLSAAINEAWLTDAERRFPVLLDPSFVTSNCGACPPGTGAPLLKDMYMTPYDGRVWESTELYAGRNEYGQDWRTYMTFDVAHEMRKVGDLVYDASFEIYNHTQSGWAPGPFELKRITADWEETGYGPPPPVDESDVWAEHPVVGWPQWWVWDVQEILQFWMDEGTPSNHGWRLGMKPGPYVEFRGWMSKESTTDPFIYATVNAMPSTRPFVVDDQSWPYLDLAADAPAEGVNVGSTPPVLKIKDLTDVNDDPIKVRYQVSRNRNDFTGANIVYDSGWMWEVHQHTVPLGNMSSGTYYWRAQASDVCDGEDADYVDQDDVVAQSANLCDDLSHDQSRPNKMHVERPTSAARAFMVERNNVRRGTDQRWAMWRQALGNDMNLAVDGASGNLSLQYAIDTLTTAAGPLELGLAYNSDAAAKDVALPGLPLGWELSGGPGASVGQIPVRIAQTHSNAASVVYESGRRDVYVTTDGVTFKTIGPQSSAVRLMPGGSWLLTTATGGTYSFDSGGALAKARASSSSHLAKGFEYTFSSDRKLETITDPNNRVTRFHYYGPGGLLSKIATWAGGEWDLVYDASYNGKGWHLVSIRDAGGSTVGFRYDTSDRLMNVTDGEEYPKLSPMRTIIGYMQRGDTPLVSSVTLPGSTQPWEYLYNFVDQQAKVAKNVTIVDPRGANTPGDPWDFKTIVDFEASGLPIMERGPAVPGNGQWPIQRWEWDKNGNLSCHKDAAATAITDLPCTTRDAWMGAETLQTEYTYQQDPPYLVTKIVHPAAGHDTSNTRLVERFTYDAGLNGLQAHWYDNANLSGLPVDASAVDTVDFDWGAGGPAQVPTRTDNFSARFFGEFRATHASGPKAYVFNAVYDDKVRVTVGDAIVIDCWASTSCVSTKSVTLEPGNHSVSVEFADTGGSAKVQLRYETSPGVFQVVPRYLLVPKTDVLTMASTNSGGTTGTGGTLLERRQYVYPIGQEYRHLPSLELFDGIRLNGYRSTQLEYDGWGKRTLVSDVQANGRRVSYSYDANGCLTATIEWVEFGTNQSTSQQCNSHGDVVYKSTLIADILDSSTGAYVQDMRVTTSTFDLLGRPTRTNYPDGGADIIAYDRAGRLKTHTYKVTASEWPATDYAYTPQGWISKITLPSPTDGAARPEISYWYDAVGNRVRKVDELGKEWTFAYNSLNLRTSKTNPVGETWTSGYDGAGRNTSSAGPEIVAGGGPSEIETKSYDVLGRIVSQKLGALTPTTFKYDPRGLVTQKTDPDGVTVKWTHDAHRNVVTETAQVGTSGAEKTRNLTYDVFARLMREEDFRGHLTEYTYDRRGLVRSVKLPHAAPNTTTYAWNYAGELERVRLPKAGGETIKTDYAYDRMGRVLEERDALGRVTTHTYDFAGQQTSTTNARGVRYEYLYDRLGRRVRESAIKSGTATAASSFAYDAAGNMTFATNETGDVSVTYDAAGRPNVVTSGGVATDHDFAGAVLKKRTDAAGVTTYDYHAPTGRVTSAVTPVSAEPVSFTYTPAGRTQTRTDPNDVVHTLGYDVAGRMTSQVVVAPTGDEIARFTQGFDADSHVVARSNQVSTGADNGAWAYQYDTAGRLVGATDPAGVSSAYEYDGAGNRTKVVETSSASGTATTTSAVTKYDMSGRPTSTTGTKQVGALPPVASGTTTYEHDPAGNLTKLDDGVTKWTYGYDSWNRMTASERSPSGAVPVSVPVSTAYSYDALGRTASKGTALTTPAGVVTQQAEQFSYAGLTNELVESSIEIETAAATTTAQTEYGYAQGVPIGQQRTTETLVPGAATPEVAIGVGFVGSGPHGDVSFLTGTTGNVIATKSYDPWGVVRSEAGDRVDLGFQGDPTDKETGLVDMGTRYYLPTLGRFTTEDTYQGEVMEPLTKNRYIYSLDDPLTMVDPTGEGPMYCDDNTCDSAEELDAHRDASQHQIAARAEGAASASGGSSGTAVADIIVEAGSIAGIISTVQSVVETVTDTAKETSHFTRLFGTLKDLAKSPTFKILGRVFSVISVITSFYEWSREHTWQRAAAQTASYWGLVTGSAAAGAAICSPGLWLAIGCGALTGGFAAIKGPAFVEWVFDGLTSGSNHIAKPIATGNVQSTLCDDGSAMKNGSYCPGYLPPGDEHLCNQEGLVPESLGISCFGAE